MSEVSNTISGSSAAIDIDAFGLELVLSRVFENMLKKPDDVPSGSADNVVNKAIATQIAQGISGFGA